MRGRLSEAVPEVLDLFESTLPWWIRIRYNVGTLRQEIEDGVNDELAVYGDSEIEVQGAMVNVAIRIALCTVIAKRAVTLGDETSAKLLQAATRYLHESY